MIRCLQMPEGRERCLPVSKNQVQRHHHPERNEGSNTKPGGFFAASQIDKCIVSRVLKLILAHLVQKNGQPQIGILRPQ